MTRASGRNWLELPKPEQSNEGRDSARAVGFIDWLGAKEDKHTKPLPKSSTNLCHWRSKLPTAPPECWRSQLHNVTGWVTKVDRTPALFPIHFQFDRAARVTE